MKIIELKAENVKRLQAVQITPEGSLVVIGGKNGAGKSSVLDSILYALGGAGTLPGKPVRKGADKATIEVTLDGDRTLIVRRKIAENGRTTLEVEQRNDDGSIAKIASPQKLLDSLVGSIAFDPLAFTRLKPAEQVESLRAAVGVSVDDLDAEIKRLFDERTAVNRDAKQLESQLGGMPKHADAPAQEVSASDVLTEIEAINQYNAAIDQKFRDADAAKAKLNRLSAAMGNLNADIDEIERKLAELEQQKEALHMELVQAQDAEVDASKAYEKAMPKKDAGPLKEKLTTIEADNAKVRANFVRAEKAEQLTAATAQADDLTQQIESLRKQRIDRMAAAAWPVDRLGFGEDGVTFNGLPFDQCSSAEQLRVSTAIALSQNPKLPIGIIRDGSLLDSESLELVAGIADQYGAQVWIERVGDGEECSIVIEDGAIAAAVA